MKHPVGRLWSDGKRNRRKWCTQGVGRLDLIWWSNRMVEKESREKTFENKEIIVVWFDVDVTLVWMSGCDPICDTGCRIFGSTTSWLGLDIGKNSRVVNILGFRVSNTIQLVEPILNYRTKTIPWIGFGLNVAMFTKYQGIKYFHQQKLK